MFARGNYYALQYPQRLVTSKVRQILFLVTVGNCLILDIISWVINYSLIFVQNFGVKGVLISNSPCSKNSGNSRLRGGIFCSSPLAFSFKNQS